MRTLFEQALHIQSPWYVKELNFNEEKKQLDIAIDFQPGRIFSYVDESSGKRVCGIESLRYQREALASPELLRA